MKTLSFLLLLSASFFFEANATWMPITANINDNFNAITARNDIYIAGDKGIYHAVNGNVNNIIRFQPSVPADSIIYNRCKFVAIAPTDNLTTNYYFAGTDTVNYKAVILRINHTTSTSSFEYIGPTNSSLNSICSGVNGLIMAVGDNGFVVHRYNSVYKEVPMSTNKNLKVIRFGLANISTYNRICIMADELVMWGYPSENPNNFDSLLTYKLLPGVVMNTMDMNSNGGHAYVFGDSMIQISNSPISLSFGNFKPKPLNAQGCYYGPNQMLWVTTDHGVYHRPSSFTAQIDNYLEFQPSSAGYSLNDFSTNNTVSFAVGDNGVLLVSNNYGLPNIPASIIKTGNGCEGQLLNLRGIYGSGTSCKWYVNSALVSNQCNGPNLSTVAGSYIIDYVVSNGLHTDTTTKVVSIVDSPKINTPVSLLDSSVICKEAFRSIKLDSLVIGNRYQLYNSTGQNYMGQFTAQYVTDTLHNIYFDLADKYFFTVTDTSGSCHLNFTDSLNIEIDETQARPFVSHTNAFPGENVNFYSWSRDADSANWTFSNTFTPVISNQIHPAHVTFADTGITNNRLIATSIHGCKDTAFLSQPYIVQETPIVNSCWINLLSANSPVGGLNTSFDGILKTSNDDLLVATYQKINLDLQTKFGLNGFSKPGTEGAVLAKYSNHGTLKWVNYFYDNYCPIGIHGIKITSPIEVDSGDYMVATWEAGGACNGPGNYSLNVYNPISSKDPISINGTTAILRLDSNGVYKKHSYLYSWDNDPILLKIIRDTATNSILMHGVVGGPFDYHNGPNITPCFSSFPTVFNNQRIYSFILKTDLDGNFKWITCVRADNTNPPRNFRNMTVDRNGNINLIGLYEHDVTFFSTNSDSLVVQRMPSNSQYGGQLYFCQYDSNGIFNWYIVATGKSDDYRYNCGLDVDTAGNIYSTIFSPPINLPPGLEIYSGASGWYYPVTDSRNCLIKISDSGTVQWTADFSDTLDFQDIKVANNKVHVALNTATNYPGVAGAIFSYGGQDSIALPNHYFSAFFTQYDFDGHVQKVFYDSLGSKNEVDIIQVEVGVDDSYYILGHIGKPYLPPPYNLFSNIVNPDNSDVFVGKINETDCGNTIVNNESTTINFIDVCSGSNHIFPDSTICTNVTQDTVQKSTFTSLQYNLDSVIVTYVNIVYSSSKNFYDTVCYGDSYMFLDSSILNSAITNLTDTSRFTQTNGCDSFLIVNLEVIQIDTTIGLVGSSMSSNQNAAFYQWYNCTLNLIIPNEINQSFTATANGSYAVIITKNNCTDTSACYPVTTIGIHDITPSKAKIYPNPHRGQFELVLDRSYKNVEVQILDISGRLIASKNYNSFEKGTINFNGAKGVYNIKVNADGYEQFIKMVKE